MAKTKKYIIGIDEVGRGPLAGPVTVAAVLLTANLKTPKQNKFATGQAYKLKNSKTPLRDSKKLSPKQREIWFYFIKKQKIPYAVANVFPKTIDKINISKAANLAATRALIKVDKLISCKLVSFKKPIQANVFLDGGLYLKNPKPKLKNLKLTNLQTIVRGDEKIPAISLASIIAKIHRDKYMDKLHKKYPQYGLEKHKGYGTKKHYRSINKNGILKIHRKSFLSSLKSK